MGAKSSVRFRRIGMQLRKEREARGLTLIAAASLLKRAPSSLSRIETGQTSICVRDLEYIMQRYGLTELLGDALLELAERGATREWWHRDAAELTPELMDFISLEADATRIRTSQTVLIPGLLQIPDYTRSLMRQSVFPTAVRRVEAAVRTRMRRQSILYGDHAPMYNAIVGEAALHQLIGGPAVMTAQLRHLQNLPPSAALRVLPYGSTIETDVTLLEIGDRGRMTLAVGQIFGRMVYEENDEQVQRMSELFEALWQQALPPSDSQELIGRIASEVEE